LHVAAPSLHHSKSALGQLYRRVRAKLGASKAIRAAAHKLAPIVFRFVTTHQEFDDGHLAADQLRFHRRQEAKFRAKARRPWLRTYSPESAASVVPEERFSSNHPVETAPTTLTPGIRISASGASR
jgi:hypothetical protein